MVIVLLQPFFKASSFNTDLLRVLPLGAGTARTDTQGKSKAFVFVNINKKHFLTSFPAFVPDEEIKDFEHFTPEQGQIVSTIKRQKTSPVKKTVEPSTSFDVKPVPQ